MKIKSLLLLAVAIGCGLVAMLGVQQVLSGSKEPASEDEVTVLVATMDIAPYMRLDQTNTAFKVVSKEAIPEGSEPVTTPEEFQDRVLRYGAVANDLILKSKLTDKGFLPSNEIPEGMRVVSVKVNQTQTHSGLIMPGDIVDILLTYKTNGGGRGSVQKTQVILQGIKIFAADNVRRSSVKPTEATEINAKNISFVVTPSQGNLLMLAESKGQLTMALRHSGDTEVVEVQAYDDSVFEGRRQASAQSEPQPDPAAAEKAQQELRKALEARGKKPPAESPKNPTWKLTIYEGRDRRDIDVELPPEASAQPASTTPLDETEETQRDNPLKTWFLKTFAPSVS